MYNLYFPIEHTLTLSTNRWVLPLLIMLIMMIYCGAHTVLALALSDLSLNFGIHEILIWYTGGFDVSEAEYCSARHHMFY